MSRMDSTDEVEKPPSPWTALSGGDRVGDPIVLRGDPKFTRSQGPRPCGALSKSTWTTF